MKNLKDSQRFLAEFEKKIVSVFNQDRVELLTERVIDSPTFHEEFRLRKNMKLSDLEIVAMAHWYLPEEIRFLVNLLLVEETKRFQPEDRFLLEVHLSTKAESQMFLLETSRWTTRSLFGKILQSHMPHFRIQRYSSRIVKPKRKRGYDDHGSMRPTTKWLPTHDFSFTNKQLEIEESRKTFEDTRDLIIGSLV